MIEILVSDKIKLQQLESEDAKDLFSLVNENRDFLRDFLPWLDKNKVVGDSEFFIQSCKEIYNENGAVSFGVFYEQKLVGMAGFHPINRANHCGAIGYWLDKHHCGMGIITSATRKIIEYGFNHLALVRIEIKCSTRNFASQAVAERLKFSFEGTLRQAEKLYDHYEDLRIYSLLESEFRSAN